MQILPRIPLSVIVCFILATGIALLWFITQYARLEPLTVIFASMGSVFAAIEAFSKSKH